MTKNDTLLLYKDLSGRTTYGTKIKHDHGIKHIIERVEYSLVKYIEEIKHLEELKFEDLGI